MTIFHKFSTLCVTLLTFASVANAQDVRITPETMAVSYSFRGIEYTIGRDQNSEATIPEFFAKTSRACPPFCIQPRQVHSDVETVEELEVLDFLVNTVSTGKGFIIDSRTADFYVKGTIPGAVNLPHNLFIPSEGNAFFGSIMIMLGGKQDSVGDWYFTDPQDLLLFCNGPWCGQSPSAIRNLLAINYPPEKLHYYRGGMQNWVSMGFNTLKP